MKKPVWKDRQTEMEYVDYHYYVPDAGGYGVKLRLTLNTAERTAWMSIMLDDDCTGAAPLALPVPLEGELNPIPWVVACAMTGHR